MVASTHRCCCSVRCPPSPRRSTRSVCRGVAKPHRRNACEIGKLVVGLGLLWAAWKLSRSLPKPRARQIEEIVTAIRAAERWTRQKYIVRLVTMRAASKRLRFLAEVPQDQQTLTEMMDAVLRIAAEEPGDPFMQKWAAVLEEGFEKGYRASAASRNVQPSELASAIANARARRRGVANQIKKGLD